MSERKNRNRWMLALIAMLSVAPLALAWFFARHPEMIEGRINYGELIIPPLPLDRSKLAGFDDFSVQNMEEIKGRWVLVHIIGPEGCNRPCRESLFKTKQLRLMLNKDLTRVRRLAMVTAKIDPETAKTWREEDSLLLSARPDEGTATELRNANQGKLAEGGLLIMDPLGNLMMRYEPGFDPYEVKKDLNRLLNVSQIG